MTVVLTLGILALPVKSMKTIVSTPFAMTCLTYYGFNALERGNDHHKYNTYNVSVNVGVCAHVRGH